MHKALTYVFRISGKLLNFTNLYNTCADAQPFPKWYYRSPRSFVSYISSCTVLLFSLVSCHSLFSFKHIGRYTNVQMIR